METGRYIAGAINKKVESGFLWGVEEWRRNNGARGYSFHLNSVLQGWINKIWHSGTMEYYSA